MNLFKAFGSMLAKSGSSGIAWTYSVIGGDDRLAFDGYDATNVYGSLVTIGGYRFIECQIGFANEMSGISQLAVRFMTEETVEVYRTVTLTLLDSSDAVLYSTVRPANSNGSTTFTHDFSPNLNGVLKLIVRAEFSGPYGFSHYVGLRLYEASLYGDPSSDSGMRVRDGSGNTVKLGAISPVSGTSKVRIRKAGAAYELMLVDVADVRASPVRFFDGTDTWAVAVYRP